MCSVGTTGTTTGTDLAGNSCRSVEELQREEIGIAELDLDVYGLAREAGEVRVFLPENLLADGVAA